MKRTPQRVIAKALLMRLTERELQCVKAIADGQPYKAIASQLGTSIKTVDWHVAQIKRRLGIHHAAALIKLAFAAGLSSL